MCSYDDDACLLQTTIPKTWDEQYKKCPLKEVVLCKDCSNNDEEDYYNCPILSSGWMPKECDTCSRGERRK